jgi:acyl-CoA reductase-like NAD-dependent aldehyde dehydrogenase
VLAPVLKNSVMDTFEIYCAGEFVKSGKEIDITEKFSGKPLARTWLADKVILDKALVAAVSVRDECAGLSSLDRYRALRSIHEEIVRKREELSALLCAESGKPLIYSRAEIDRAAQCFLIASEECKRLPKEYMSLDWT